MLNFNKIFIKFYNIIVYYLSERGLSIPEAKECVKDRREWRRIVGGRRR